MNFFFLFISVASFSPPYVMSSKVDDRYRVFDDRITYFLTLLLGKLRRISKLKECGKCEKPFINGRIVGKGNVTRSPTWGTLRKFAVGGCVGLIEGYTSCAAGIYSHAYRMFYNRRSSVVDEAVDHFEKLGRRS